MSMQPTYAILDRDSADLLHNGERSMLRPFLIAKPQNVWSDERKCEAVNELLMEMGK